MFGVSWKPDPGGVEEPGCGSGLRRSSDTLILSRRGSAVSKDGGAFPPAGLKFALRYAASPLLRVRRTGPLLGAKGLLKKSLARERTLPPRLRSTPNPPCQGIKATPPTPPYQGGKKKQKPLCRRRASPFHTPLIRGGRGGWFSSREGRRLYDGGKPQPRPEQGFFNGPFEGWVSRGESPTAG